MMKRLSLVFCLFGVSTMAFAGPADDAEAVVGKWAKAITELDVDSIVSLYSPDALFFGTESKALVNKPDGIRKYFEAALLSGGTRSAVLGEHSTLVVSDSVVVVTGLDTVGGVLGGNSLTSIGRVTFVVAKRGDAWKVVDYHRSAMPK